MAASEYSPILCRASLEVTFHLAVCTRNQTPHGLNSSFTKDQWTKKSYEGLLSCSRLCIPFRHVAGEVLQRIKPSNLDDKAKQILEAIEEELDLIFYRGWAQVGWQPRCWSAEWTFKQSASPAESHWFPALLHIVWWFPSVRQSAFPPPSSPLECSWA